MNNHSPLKARFIPFLPQANARAGFLHYTPSINIRKNYFSLAMVIGSFSLHASHAAVSPHSFFMMDDQSAVALLGNKTGPWTPGIYNSLNSSCHGTPAMGSELSAKACAPEFSCEKRSVRFYIFPESNDNRTSDLFSMHSRQLPRHAYKEVAEEVVR